MSVRDHLAIVRILIQFSFYRVATEDFEEDQTSLDSSGELVPLAFLHLIVQYIGFLQALKSLLVHSLVMNWHNTNTLKHQRWFHLWSVCCSCFSWASRMFRRGNSEMFFFLYVDCQFIFGKRIFFVWRIGYIRLLVRLTSHSCSQAFELELQCNTEVHGYVC